MSVHKTARGGWAARRIELCIEPVLTVGRVEALLASADGYWTHPRTLDNGDIGDRLGIAENSARQRIRGAENKIMVAVIEELVREVGCPLCGGNLWRPAGTRGSARKRLPEHLPECPERGAA